MRIHLLGGASEVGASCVVVEAGGRRVLLDAGVRLNAPDPLPDLRRLQEIGGIDAVVVTHAHADHIGALPLAAGAFPLAPLVATPPTLALMAVMLQDALRIAEIRQEAEGEIPPYGPPQVQALLDRLRPLPLGQPYLLLPDWSVTLYPAGHILGAAMAWLDTPEGSVLVSGDVSLAAQRTVSPAVPPRRRPLALVLESTYGDKLHSRRADEEARLVAQVAAVLQRGGHCLIPAFALGRAQEVLLVLSDARRRGLLPATCRVWVDGLVRAVCGVYQAYGQSGAPGLRRLIAREGDPFFSADGPVQPVRRAEERQRILQGEPAVIVASSGMLTGGPSAFYAAALAAEERHAILITGYQDEEAPGRRLLALAELPTAARSLTLNGTEVPVRCTVERYHLSAHADGDELAALAARLRPHLTLLVHGEAAARAALGEKIAAQGLAVRLPQNGEAVDLPARSARIVAATRRADPTAEDLVQLARLAGTRRAWSAVELAERWWGAATAEGVEHVRALLQGTGGPFAVDRMRPTLYRLAEAGAAAGGETSDQESVRQLLAEAFAAEPDLLRAGLYPADRRVELRFRFPRVAERRHTDTLEGLRRRSGWSITLRATPDTGALQEAALRHLPQGIRPLQAVPSVHLDRGLVEVRAEGHAAPEALAAAREAFRAQTGFTLGLLGLNGTAREAPSTPGQARGGPRVEQNRAFAAIREALAARGETVYRLSLRGEAIEASFLTPRVGQRVRPLLDGLQADLGWPLRVAEQPQQQALIALVRGVVGRPITRGPGVHAAEGRVRLRLAPGEVPAAEDVAAWQKAVEEAAGYLLEVET